MASDEYRSMRKRAVSIDQIAQLSFVAEELKAKGVLQSSIESKMVVSSTRVASLAVGINAVRGKRAGERRWEEIFW